MIRDEASRVVDVRIPPNGYRRYIKELSRTGAFGQLQHENMIIILLEAVEELQQQVQEFRSSRETNASSLTLKEVEEKYKAARSIEIPKIMELPEEKQTPYPSVLGESSAVAHLCDICKKSFKNNLGLMGHMRSHKNVQPTTTTKSDTNVPVQSE